MVTREVKEFCAHNLVATIINDMKEYFPDKDENQILSDFTSSKTYSQLFRIETGLWAEGPDYILDIYFEEKGINIDGVFDMSERKLMGIIHFQSECVVGYSRFANISITESSKLFTKYNLFEFIKKCYDVLHLDDIEYVIENDIAERITNGVYYHPSI